MASGELGRREFLRWAATGAAGLLVPAIDRPRTTVFDMGRRRGVLSIEQRRGIFRSVQPGPWGAPATWGGLLVPQRHADVTVRHEVVLGGVGVSSSSIEVVGGGRLDFDLGSPEWPMVVERNRFKRVPLEAVMSGLTDRGAYVVGNAAVAPHEVPLGLAHIAAARRLVERDTSRLDPTVARIEGNLFVCG